MLDKASKKRVKKQVGQMVGQTVGIVGLNVASRAAGGIPGQAGVIVRQGALPMMGTGLMADAAKSIDIPRGRKK